MQNTKVYTVINLISLPLSEVHLFHHHFSCLPPIPLSHLSLLHDHLSSGLISSLLLYFLICILLFLSPLPHSHLIIGFPPLGHIFLQIKD